MGYILELLPKEFITTNDSFLNTTGTPEDLKAASRIRRTQETSASTYNIPSDVPASYREALDKANNKRAQALTRLNKLSSDLEYKKRLLALIKEKMQSDNTGAISEAIVMSGRCGQQAFDKERLIVNLDGVAAKGCSDPVLNPVGRKREVDYANNYWRKVLPSEIATIESNISKENENIKSADEEISKAEAAINKYLQTKAEYDLKQAEAKNFPEAQRIKAEKEAALRALEIEASERSRRAELRSKNIRVGLLIAGGITLLVGGIYLMRKNK